MANRQFNQFRYSLETMVVDLFMKVTFGSSGAPTINYGKGIKSMTRTSAGLYVVNLSDKYQKLLIMKHVFINATAPASPGMYVVTDNSAGSSPSVTITFNSAGTATDPASGEIVLMQICLSNSSV